MMTLRQLAGKPETVPVATAWYLADLGEARGKQELFAKQAPQRLKALREHALIESAVSSNRIEGVLVEPARIRPVIIGKAPLRDRDEEEVRGYRHALSVIHQQGAKRAVSEATILELHRLARGGVGDAGQYKKTESDIIERYPDGRQRVRFKTMEAAKTPAAMAELVTLWNQAMEERWVHPLIALAAFNLDFLCIHPFRDGNGRVSRLLLLLQSYHVGYDVGRYISLERVIEQNKERYYETLEHSSHRWHEAQHDPWPYINYLLFILKDATREFESRVEQIASPKGAKTELVTVAIARATGPFRVADLQRACPGVGLDMIRKILKRLQSDKQITCLGRGQRAQWQKTGKWGI